MKHVTTEEGTKLESQIEELEQKIAPDGGETVLPLAFSLPFSKKH